MFFYNIKHNPYYIFCILLMINGCNNENSKLIVENKNYRKIKTIIKYLFNKNPNVKNIKKEIKRKKSQLQEKKLKQVIMLFLNLEMKDYFKEEISNNNIDEKKTKLALSAVQKMFKKI